MAAGALLCGCANTTNELSPQTALAVEQVKAAALINKAKVESLTGRSFGRWTKADVELWQAMNLQSALPFLQQEQANEAARRQAAGQILASGLKNAAESIRSSAPSPAYPPQVHIPQMPRQYLRMNPITGKMETVTEYSNGFQSVSPVGQ